MKKFASLLCCLALLAVCTAPAVFAEDGNSHAGTWTGEVLDLACYLAQGAKGPDHAGCAKGCVKGGQPMALLTDDGKVYVLSADHADGSAFEALKDLAGAKAEVGGDLVEKDGIKLISVKSSKAAS